MSATKIAIEIVDESDRQCWEAYAPVGYRFASGPHSLVCPYGSGPLGMEGISSRAAKAELKRRVAADSIEKCPPHCECGGEW